MCWLNRGKESSHNRILDKYKKRCRSNVFAFNMQNTTKHSTWYGMRHVTLKLLYIMLKYYFQFWLFLLLLSFRQEEEIIDHVDCPWITTNATAYLSALWVIINSELLIFGSDISILHVIAWTVCFVIPFTILYFTLCFTLLQLSIFFFLSVFL